jgi:uncharacterized membrane protein YdbT with pleckstrin-like domain
MNTLTAPARSNAALPPPDAAETVLFEGHPVALRSLGRWLAAVLTVGLAALFWWVGAQALRIRISNERITVKRGLFSRTTDTVELYRVTDMQVREPFLERMVGCGRLAITSSDRGQSVMELEGLRSVEALADAMRKAVEHQKVQKRIHTHQDA